MIAVTQYQVKVNGALQFSSSSKNLAKSKFNRAKARFKRRHVTFEKVKELARHKPLTRAQVNKNP